MTYRRWPGLMARQWRGDLGPVQRLADQRLGRDMSCLAGGFQAASEAPDFGVLNWEDTARGDRRNACYPLNIPGPR